MKFLFIIIFLFSPLIDAAPKRIASVNLCTDQYLLLLAVPDTIATVSFLSQQQKSSYYYERALAIPVNHGEAEEIVAHAPDLVLAGFYSARTTTQLLQRLGYRVELFDHPRSIQQVREQLRRMGDLIGRREQAERVINEMNERLKSVATQPAADAPTLMQYAPGGFTVGRDSLVGDIIYQAGWRNQATKAGVAHLGIVDLETLLVIAPLVLIDSPLAPDSYSFAEQMLKHPVLKKSTRPKFTVTIERKLWICGGPMVVDALIELRKARKIIETL
ncbi:Vitamin B12 ABC transporter, B12-binding component BtuF [hydrothermal vent metagenome]|uniref:Vitamin B12 ABC transporter, B12-binding component BtuF n=1 Tax=hydrothermal vent metagenome TaxID=652676 RepID=A0A3B1A7F6_9ZZZZ